MPPLVAETKKNDSDGKEYYDDRTETDSTDSVSASSFKTMSEQALVSSPTHSTASDKTIMYDYPDDENSEKESSTKDDEAIGDFDDDRTGPTGTDSVSAFYTLNFDESNAQGVAV